MRAFTLIELLVSLSIMSILLVAMGSAIMLAGRAVPEAGGPDQSVIDAWLVADRIASEVSAASSFTERTDRAVTFTLADRDGDGAPETVRYAWSGTEGEPLVRRQNGGPDVTVAPSIADFALDYRLQDRRRPLRVLLVVPDEVVPNPHDEARRALFQAWGYPVVVFPADATAGAYRSAASMADVAYVSERVSPLTVGTKLRDAVIGVVIEERALSDEMGLSSSAGTYDDDTIRIIANTHEITSGFDLSNLKIMHTDQDLNRTAGLVAPGLVRLARQPGGTSTCLGVIEAGGALFDGSPAAGRRVFLPWGSGPLDFAKLNDDGRTLLQRALEWAAGPSVLTGVQVTVQTSEPGRSRLETEVRVLNEPGVPGP